MVRILGLDVGERRIGVAISDPEGRIAVPLRILERASAERAIAALARASGLPIEFWDERLSSVQADRTSAAARKRTGRGPRRRRTPTDDVAAAIILQGYLDRQRAQRERDDS